MIPPLGIWTPRSSYIADTFIALHSDIYYPHLVSITTSQPWIPCSLTVLLPCPSPQGISHLLPVTTLDNLATAAATRTVSCRPRRSSRPPHPHHCRHPRRSHHCRRWHHCHQPHRPLPPATTARCHPRRCSLPRRPLPPAPQQPPLAPPIRHPLPPQVTPCNPTPPTPLPSTASPAPLPTPASLQSAQITLINPSHLNPRHVSSDNK